MKGTSKEAASPLKTVLVEDTAGFEALEAEWEDLYRSSTRATPFQSWSWLFSWWEFYGGACDLEITTFREPGSRLVGVLPLMRKKGRLRRLLFLGTGMTEYHDMLVHPEWLEEVSEAAAIALARQVGGWGVADLQQLRDTAVFWNVLPYWNGPRVCMWNADHLQLKAAPWEEVLAGIGKKRRETARRTLRRADKEGISRQQVPATDLGAATGRWISLHRDYWSDRDINPEHLTARFEDFMGRVIRRMTGDGTGKLIEFRKGEEVVAADFVMVGHDFVTGFLEGANDYARRNFELNTLYMHTWLEIAQENGVENVSLMLGEEPYKLNWKPGRFSNRRVILSKNRASLQFYSAYRRTRLKVASHLSKPDDESSSPLASFGNAYRKVYRDIRRRI